MTPMLYPNSRDPRTAVKTDRARVPVTVWEQKQAQKTHKEA